MQALMLTLTLVSGLAWTIVYLAAIRLGFAEKTYAIPAAAIALNIAWELLYTGTELAGTVSVQTPVDIAWSVLDLVIVITFLRFGRAELPVGISRSMFVGWVIVLLGSSAVVQGLFVHEFGWFRAPRYAAFLQNLLMSGLFLAMYVARRGKRGQSVLIALAKWIGTLAPTLLFGVLERSAFIVGIGLLCSVFDLVYLGLMVRDPLGRRPSDSPPRRPFEARRA